MECPLMGISYLFSYVYIHNYLKSIIFEQNAEYAPA